VTPEAVDHYARLGVTRDATPEEVARAFRRLAREMHPDVGGSAPDFAAAAEAYRVLSEATARAEYDRELDGGAADWADVGWGSEIGDVPAPDDADACSVGAPPDIPDDGPLDPWSLDPFVGGPRRIPDPLAPRALPEIPHLAPAPRETVAGVLACLLAVATLVLRFVGSSATNGLGPSLGEPGADQPDSAVIMWLVFWGIAIGLHASRAPGSGGARVGWAMAAVASGYWIAMMGGGWSAPLIASIPTGLGALGIGIAWARASWARRADPRRTAALRERDRPTLIDRHQRAVAWNRVRAELLRPGRTVLVVGAPAMLLTGERAQGERWTYDPRTRAEMVRHIPDDLPHGSWVVLDDEDRVVATAPAYAPEAWLEALQSGHVGVQQA